MGLWQRFVDASFPEQPECEIRTMLRQRLLEGRGRHRCSAKPQLANYDVPPVGSVARLYDDFAPRADLPIPLGSLPELESYDVVNAEGRLVRKVYVAPKRARPYVEMPTSFLEQLGPVD